MSRRVFLVACGLFLSALESYAPTLANEHHRRFLNRMAGNVRKITREF